MFTCFTQYTAKSPGRFPTFDDHLYTAQTDMFIRELPKRLFSHSLQEVSSWIFNMPSYQSISTNPPSFPLSLPTSQPQITIFPFPSPANPNPHAPQLNVFTLHKSDEGVSVNSVAVVPGATEALSGGDDQQAENR